MPTLEEAVTRLQAQFRGLRWRKRWHQAITALTRLQARQRGRFTRREFAQLRAFSREQEGFQQATRRRQLRIWRNEQELYFLRHTNAADLERVREFQQQHAAKLIQRAWRSVAGSTGSETPEKPILHPRDRIYVFDPFGVAVAAESPVSFSQWSRDDDDHGRTSSPQSLFLCEYDSNLVSAEKQAPAAIADDSTLASRRKAIQERIKRRVAQQKTEKAPQAKRQSPFVNGVSHGAEPSTNPRRELYEQLVKLQSSTARRVLRYQRECRTTRAERELATMQLIASCENRLRHLQAESPEQLMPTQIDTQQVTTGTNSVIDGWDSARKIRAWNHHRRAVKPALERRHWWQTQLAGEQRDIRRVVLLSTPWEDDGKVWSWPRKVDNNGDLEHEDGAGSKPKPQEWTSPEIELFLCGVKNHDNGVYQEKHNYKAIRDQEASEWWRAHCTQPHLAVRKLQQETTCIPSAFPYSGDERAGADVDGFPVCTPEVVANRELYKLQKRAKQTALSKSLALDVERRSKALETQIQRRVHEMEEQVEANTQLALELAQRKQRRRARISREQQAAITIQRYTRGMQGRRCARERWAEFFVLVRGRAIRRGRCEECGDERAVLECQQCEESVHFCPLCWVHVHSTRRRKTHVAIPMSAVVAPVSGPEPMKTNDTDAGALTGPDLADDSEPSDTVVKDADVAGEDGDVPRRQSLLVSCKNSSARLAEPVTTSEERFGHQVAFDQVAENIGVDQVKAKELTPLIYDVGDGENELAEACALARRVRTEVAGAQAEVEEIKTNSDVHVNWNGDSPVPGLVTTELMMREKATPAPLEAGMMMSDAPALSTGTVAPKSDIVAVKEPSTTTTVTNALDNAAKGEQQQRPQLVGVDSTGTSGNGLGATLSESSTAVDVNEMSELGGGLLPQDCQDHDTFTTTKDELATVEEKQQIQATADCNAEVDSEAATIGQSAATAVGSSVEHASTTVDCGSSVIVENSSQDIPVPGDQVAAADDTTPRENEQGVAAAHLTTASSDVDATGGDIQTIIPATETVGIGTEATGVSTSQDKVATNPKPVGDEDQTVTATKKEDMDGH